MNVMCHIAVPMSEIIKEYEKEEAEEEEKAERKKPAVA
jgi:Na+-transporting methylmalonyl-CoA/oxaloacetate decarboxylase gamma subunit